MRIFNLLGCSAVLCVVLAACSDSSGPTSELSCDVAPADEMGATLGVAGLKDPTSKTTYGTLVCSYATADSENAVILRMEEASADGFAADRKSFEDLGITTVDIEGLGEEAYSASNSTGAVTSITVVAWDGAVEVQISTTGTTIEAVTSMITTILTRV